VSTIQLRETSPEEWLAAIVDSSDDAIIGKTLDSVIRSWNSSASRIFGYAPEEIIGRSVLTLIPSELQHEEPQILARLVRGERIDHYETTRLRKDGSRIEVSLSVSPIRDRAGVVVGAAKIARDITEAKRLQRAEREQAEQLQELAIELENQVEEAQSLQEELEQANEELVRALDEAEKARRSAEKAKHDAEEANGAKSQFLATMSHELRTPLNAIAGYVDLLDAGIRGALNDSQRQDLARIKRSQQTLLRLIEDVLSFAKLESGHLEFHLESVPLDDVLGSLEAFIAPHIGQKQLEYSVESCGPDVLAYIDRTKVQQIALNLLSNALKFTDRGRISVSCVPRENAIHIHVRDTGRGIDPALLDSIFEPFVQGDRSFTRTSEGTGLGLSISRELARAMGGDVTVESTLGVGSTFTLVLPRRTATGLPR
jgi:PAS domain S-box-containing protein